MGGIKRKRKASAEVDSAPVLKKNVRNDGALKRTASACSALLNRKAPSIRITRGMTTRASRDVVFKTAELLENIILHLPIHTVIALPRVCKLFKVQIETSSAIQRKLFKRLDGKGTETWTMTSDKQYICTEDAPSDPRSRTRNLKVPSSLNSLFYKRWYGFEGELYAIEAMHRAFLHALQGRSLPIFSDMHFSDAAPTRVGVAVYWNDGSGGKGFASFYQQDNAGYTIGKALQCLREYVPAYPYDSKPDQVRNDKTMEEIFKSGGKKHYVTAVKVTLVGVLFPSAAQRQACLPLPSSAA